MVFCIPKNICHNNFSHTFSIYMKFSKYLNAMSNLSISLNDLFVISKYYMIILTNPCVFSIKTSN